MCQNRTDSQKPLSGACAKVHGHATAQLQLSNQSPVMCQLGISVMRTPVRKSYKHLFLHAPLAIVEAPAETRLGPPRHCPAKCRDPAPITMQSVPQPSISL